jgi:hypothetical protein
MEHPMILFIWKYAPPELQDAFNTKLETGQTPQWVAVFGEMGVSEIREILESNPIFNSKTILYTEYLGYAAACGVGG